MSEKVQVEVTDQEVSTPQEPTQPQYTEIEQRALAQGWKPLAEWDGDANEHRSAREYLDRGELIGKIKSLSTEYQELRKTMSTLSEHNKNVYRAGYESALADLKAKKADAIREGDAEAVVEIDEKIDETKETIRNIDKAAKVDQQIQVPPESQKAFNEWVAKNPWYLEDEEMHIIANSMAIAYGKRVNRPVSDEEIYSHLDKKMREKFPQMFKKENQSAPHPDGQGRSGTGKPAAKPSGGDDFDKVVATLDDQDARNVRKMIKDGWVTKEEWVKQFKQVNDKGRR